MSVQDIISKALIEYDTAQPTIRYLVKYADYEGERPGTDWQRTKFRFIDKKTDDVILETEVETLAVYYDKMDIWSWAWSLTGLTNAENYLAKEILIYALKLGSDLAYLKSILTTSRGVIDDVTQIEVNLAIACSIIKQPYIYPFVYKIENNYLVYYLILLNKTDLDKLSERIKNDKEFDDFNYDD